MRLRAAIRSIALLSPFLCSIAAADAAGAAATPERDPGEVGQQFYRAKAEGWFWHEDLALPKPKKKKVDEPKPVATAPEVKAPESAAPAGSTPLSVAWIRENLPKVRDQAIDTGNPEDVRAYYYLQRVMMDKSQKFAETSTDVIRTDPMLDEDTRRPVGTFAANAMTTMAGEKRSALLKQISKRAGFYFFFDSACGLCAAQANVVEMLAARTGLSVIAVSLDGKPMNGTALYKNFRRDQGQAAALGITQAPALALGMPATGEVKIVSFGVVALDVLENRVLLAARDGGLITPSQYENTRPIQNNGLFTGDAIAGVDAEKAKTDPAEFVNMLRERFAQSGDTQ